jgi:hypothetical protein
MLFTGTRIPDPLFPHMIPPTIMVWIFVIISPAISSYISNIVLICLIAFNLKKKSMNKISFAYYLNIQIIIYLYNKKKKSFLLNFVPHLYQSLLIYACNTN